MARTRTKKPRMGRPPLGDAKRRKIVAVRLTQEEWDAVADKLEEGDSHAAWFYERGIAALGS